MKELSQLVERESSCIPLRVSGLPQRSAPMASRPSRRVPVTVENIPGAGGSVGAERVAKSAPDGSTFYWGANGAMTINPSLQPSPTFDPVRDLAPIARVLVMPSILAVNNEVPAKTVAELFALAKETRCNVGGATSREADNDAHRSP